jgi:hypothetical protein
VGSYSAIDNVKITSVIILYGDNGCHMQSAVQYGDNGCHMQSAVQYGDNGCHMQ